MLKVCGIEKLSGELDYVCEFLAYCLSILFVEAMAVPLLSKKIVKKRVKKFKRHQSDRFISVKVSPPPMYCAIMLLLWH